MTGFITMIRDVSDVVIDVSHTTIINTSNIAIVAAAYAPDSWKSLAPSPPLLEPSANDISGILLGTTIIQGTDLSGITIGDNCTASGEYAVAMGLTEIDRRPGVGVPTTFGRRGPWVEASKEITVEHSTTALHEI